MLHTRWYLPFFMPSTMLMLGIAASLVIALVAARRSARSGGRANRWARIARAARSATLTLVALLLVAANPLFANWLARATEAPHVPVDPATLPQADCIVVLAGGVRTVAGPDGYLHTQQFGAGDRFDSGVRAYQAERAPLIAFGSGRPNVPGAPNEAEFNRDRAICMGVPADAIILGAESSFTSDEAANLAGRLRGRGVRSIILCTSAYHLNRAIPHYESFGFSVTPLPSDFLVATPLPTTDLRMLLPSADALDRTDCCAKEWLGWAAAHISPPDRRSAAEG